MVLGQIFALYKLLLLLLLFIDSRRCFLSGYCRACAECDIKEILAHRLRTNLTPLPLYMVKWAG